MDTKQTLTERDDDGEEVQRTVTRRKQIRYLHDTRDWYETWARSPMAATFTGVEWNRLQRLARLVDAYYRRPSKELACEMRLQEASFGGSPLDRLRAQMKIVATDTEGAPRTSAGSSSSRRSRLSVVK
ncbi:MAG: hypothetical protein Q8O56_06270 [Solirubrobacteraceae bacterium]|nr:hypothetical protein [Solirubrobacteraceae bacterium]